MKNNIYFNTTRKVGTKLQKSIDKARFQNDKILLYFKNFKTKNISPEEVHINVFNQRVPLTSVRRSFTTLAKDGVLAKTDKMVLGYYPPDKVHTWVLCK